MSEGERPAPHVEETVEQLTRLYDEHHAGTTPLQRAANSVTAALARPTALVGTLLVVLGWVVGNGVARFAGSRGFEAFPFPDLGFVSTVAALVIALLILTTQRHEEALAEKRARLTLQIAALSEKKIAKIIELLEEQRRDNPLLPTRHDEVAAMMAKPVNPTDVVLPG